jgi:hypothetical protein
MLLALLQLQLELTCVLMRLQERSLEGFKAYIVHESQQGR